MNTLPYIFVRFSDTPQYSNLEEPGRPRAEMRWNLTTHGETPWRRWSDWNLGAALLCDADRLLAGGSRMPASHETVDRRLHFVHQEGQQVFKYAVRKMLEVCRDLLDRNGLTLDDVAVMIPHQANIRIITAASDRLGMPREKVLIDIDHYGNTTSGTIPLATRDAIQQGLLKRATSCSSPA